MWVLVPVALLVLIGVYVLLGKARRDARDEGPITPQAVTDELVSSKDGAQGGKETARPRAPQPAAPDDIDRLIDDVVEQFDEKMKINAEIEVRVAANMQTIHRSQNAIWANEDETYLSMPKYDEVRDKILEKADELLGSIDGDDADAIAQLAQEQLDAFWDKGSLAEEEAYVHGWLARGVLELALEKDPENFHLLSLLKEAIGSVTLVRVKGEVGLNPFLEMWPVLDKQEKLIRAGKVEPSPEVMLAMYDWSRAVLAAKRNLKAGVPGWEWMVENAESCGWGKLEPILAMGLESNRKGIPVCPTLFVLSPDDVGGRDNWVVMNARHQRRPCEIIGSKAYRENVMPLWEVYGTDKVVTVLRPPQ